MHSYYVRHGILGEVASMTADDGARYVRGQRVICRTPRGLELGEILAPVDPDSASPSRASILRRVTIEDDLLIARLEKNRHQAAADCARLLAERGAQVTLMDAEVLFDGQTVLFYFLGELTSDLEPLVAELAEAYEGRVQFRKFGETLTAGCGPDCGTEKADGHGCVSCISCSVASACGTKKKSAAHT